MHILSLSLFYSCFSEREMIASTETLKMARKRTCPQTDPHLAERGDSNPRDGIRRQHDFQSCTLNRSDTSPCCFSLTFRPACMSRGFRLLGSSVTTDLIIIHIKAACVNGKFTFFQKFSEVFSFRLFHQGQGRGEGGLSSRRGLRPG